MTLNITVLISGSGSNLQALIDSEAKGDLNGIITQVVSSSTTAYGLERAEKAKISRIKTHVLKDYYKGTTKEEKVERGKRREQFNKDLANLLIYGNKENTITTEGYVKPDLIVCAGWMLILSPAILIPLENAGITIINLHPALPGAYDGTHAIDRCWKDGQDGKITRGGVMIHKVIAEVDRGEPVLVTEIELKKDESLEEYEDRVHKVEHVAIVEGANKILKELEVIKGLESLKLEKEKKVETVDGGQDEKDEKK
ncbi:phosphoribosylglycinamide formyltransferase [[Candida] railenensis]|uniref:Phosphoribosylglycinamide formyltransferase n=1 Tax=[Candida] railenensis TaxID=45579 RepID=A0A9P0QNN2_9ASCO|nr:phosphoribosylglycinamide formyltransferase [[Candida] railenensis]